jgi:hypothetical protein
LPGLRRGTGSNNFREPGKKKAGGIPLIKGIKIMENKTVREKLK